MSSPKDENGEPLPPPTAGQRRLRALYKVTRVTLITCRLFFLHRFTYFYIRMPFLLSAPALAVNSKFAFYCLQYCNTAYQDSPHTDIHACFIKLIFVIAYYLFL